MAIQTKHYNKVVSTGNCDGRARNLPGGGCDNLAAHEPHPYEWSYESHTAGGEHIESTFEGAVFCDRERNYYDDSDGYSHVFNSATGNLEERGTWTTRAGTNHVRTVVDAYTNEDPAMVEAMRQAHIAKLRTIAFMLMERNFEQAEYDATVPSKGDTARVVKGRKVAIGTTGEIIWTGERSYSYGPATLRVGIKDADGNVHWTAASNVEVVNPVMPDAEDFFTMDAMLKVWSTMSLRELHAAYCGSMANMSGLIAAGRF
jgi:hypothetical protein